MLLCWGKASLESKISLGGVLVLLGIFGAFDSQYKTDLDQGDNSSFYSNSNSSVTEVC